MNKLEYIANTEQKYMCPIFDLGSLYLLSYLLVSVSAKAHSFLSAKDTALKQRVIKRQFYVFFATLAYCTLLSLMYLRMPYMQLVAKYSNITNQ